MDLKKYKAQFLSFFFFSSSTTLLLPTHLPPPSCKHAQSCNPMDCSPPGSSVHGLFQARILGWVAVSFSKGQFLIVTPTCSPQFYPSLVIIVKNLFILQKIPSIYTGTCVCVCVLCLHWVGHGIQTVWASLVTQIVKNLPAMQETWVQSLGWEDPLEKGMVPTPVLLPGEFHGQRSLVSYSPWDHRVGQSWATNTHFSYKLLDVPIFFLT